MATGLGSEFSASGGALTYQGSAEGLALSERFECDPAKQYEISITGQNFLNSPVHKIGVAFYDLSGNLIDSVTSDASGWASIGDYHVYKSDEVFATFETEYSTTFGAGESLTIPTGAKKMAIAWVANTGAASNAEANIRDPHIRETGTRQFFDDPDTWAWSDNPSVCLADYLTQVMNIAEDEIDWENMIVAANACDVTVAVPAPDNAEPRFTCNGSLSLGDTHRENIEAILSSMSGRIAWRQGRWSWWASVWANPTITIDGDWLVEEPVEGQGFAGRAERYNTIEGFYIDPDRLYEPVEFNPVQSSAYLSRDEGVPIAKDLELPMTNSEWMAQRIAFRLLEEGNNFVTAKLVVNEKGAQLGVHDRVNVDLPPLGWTAGGNLLKWSEDHSKTLGPIWERQRVSVTLDRRPGPFGGETPDRIECNETGAAYFRQISLNAGSDEGVTYAAWIRRGSGAREANAFQIKNETTASVLALLLIDYDTGEIYSDLGVGQRRIKVLQFPNKWLRLIVQCFGLVSDNDDIGVYEGFYGGTGNLGEYCWVDKSQLIRGLDDNPPYIRAEANTVTTQPKRMRVIEWTPQLDGTYELALVEDQEGDYTDPIVGEYVDVDAPQINAPALIVPAPQNLTGVPVTGGVLLDWDDPPSRLYSRIEIWASDDNNRANAELIASVVSSPFTDNVLPSNQLRYYWIRARRNDGVVSEWEPSSATGGEDTFPELPPPLLVADRFIRLGASYWDVSDSQVAYTTGGGTNGGDRIVFSGSGAGDVLTAQRRGPAVFDPEAAEGMVVEIRSRVKYNGDGSGGWSVTLNPFVWVTDEDGTSNAVFYGPSSAYSFDETSGTGWIERSFVIEIDSEAAQTPPRYIQIGMRYSGNNNGATYSLDMLDATIAAAKFDGAGKPGTVPDPGSSSGLFLKDDGTWDTPA